MNGLIQTAYNAIQSQFSNLKMNTVVYQSVDIQENYNKATGIFITLWKIDKNGNRALRGCIGRHSRRFDNIIEEVADCAIQSAFFDDRFEPVRIKELKNIKIEISLLSAPEKIESLHQLNPMKYGIIIQAGYRAGTLLPEIEGVDTVDKQFQIVCRKAGVHPTEKMDLYRFEVQKVVE